MKIFFLIIYNANLHSPLCKKHFKEDGGGGGVFISIENVLIGLKMYDYHFCKIVKHLKLDIWKI